MIDVGGVCWYKAGSLQSKLMIFVPRAIALVGVIVLCKLGAEGRRTRVMDTD